LSNDWTVARYVFAGAHAISPHLLDRIGPGKADIVLDFYIPMLESGEQIAAMVFAGRWHDLGTPQRFLDATLDWARAEGVGRLWRRSWISPGAGVVSGGRERPWTLAPKVRSHSASQLPLKPVCPVTSTLRPFQNEWSIMLAWSGKKPTGKL